MLKLFDFQTKENQSLKNVQNEMVDLKHRLEGLKSVDAENKKLNVILIEKERELEKIQNIVKAERDEKMDILQVIGYFTRYFKKVVQGIECRIFHLGQRKEYTRERTREQRTSK